MRTRAKVALALVLALAVAVPAFAATTPTGKTADQIRTYYSSGLWNRAVKKQANKAKAYVIKRTHGRHPAKKPALVLDIDETSLNNYPCLNQSGGIPYSAVPYAVCVVAYNAPAMVEYSLAPPLRQPTAGPDPAPVEKWLATFTGPMSMEVRDLEVTAEGSVAFCTSLNCLTATPVGQPEPFSLWFRVTLGLRRIDGAWLVVHEHESVPFDMDGSFRASIGLEP